VFDLSRVKHVTWTAGISGSALLYMDVCNEGKLEVKQFGVRDLNTGNPFRSLYVNNRD